MILTSSACGRLLLRRTHNLPCIFKRSKSFTPLNTVSPQPPTADSLSTAKTIPGPSWLWLEPVAAPFRAYGRANKRRPYVTQLISSLVIYFIGDICAQNISPASVSAPHSDAPLEGEEEQISKQQQQQAWKPYDPFRTLRALCIGGISSIPSYTWFIWLGNHFNYSSKIVSLTVKVVVNQIVFTPVFNSYFFGMQSLLTGATGEEIVERIRNTVPVSWVNSCKIWPVVTAFSFAYVPLEYRSIFGGVIAIGWQTYLSLLNQRAALQEQTEHAHEHDVVVAGIPADKPQQQQQAEG
ncbi:hypothetical protein GQ43DRAFT_446956 [Delitschia confertaspora ATCC 74209]|uniref:Mpv17 / PMP22 family protein n=1 Tax=Delitschia confertaspora ATCC 74209 TaxID=1513339 RepID=A0A9P4JTI0_9PLEO|nr:hypothetical protein GQ43DRAFT_446956 [Delitschia confertaspora ATCC 74209]